MRFFRSASRENRLQPERRSGTRIVTLKNAGWLALAVTVLFLIVSAYMERRARGGENYGRLYDERIESSNPPPAAAPPEVILEEAEAPPARPDSRRRDELLGVTSTMTEPVATAAPAIPPPVRRRRGDGRVVITGGTEGVRMDVQPPAPQPQPPAEATATTTDPPPSH